MEQYIPKSAVMAEIEKKKIPFKKDIDDGVYPTYLCALMDFEDFINTFETKEANLEKEITPSSVENMLCCFGVQSIDDMDSEDLVEFARHFFKLGLFSQLTWQDIRLISEIGEKFMNSEESDNLSEEEYYTAILNKLKESKTWKE